MENDAYSAPNVRVETGISAQAVTQEPPICHSPLGKN